MGQRQSNVHFPTPYSLMKNKPTRGYYAIGLFNPKTPVNVGSVLRAAGIFDAAFVAKTGQRYHGSPTDTRKQYRHLPLIQTEDLHEICPYDCVPVAVDLLEDARPLPTYTHPERAFYIFGPEDGTLGSTITSWCRDKIYIPTNGCANLAAAVNIVLYDRIAKFTRSAPCNQHSTTSV